MGLVYLPYELTINVGKYTSPMDGMGYISSQIMRYVFHQSLKNRLKGYVFDYN